MQCHECPTTLEIQSGKWRNTPFEATPCAACQQPRPDNHKGRCHVQFQDAIHSPKVFDFVEKLDDGSTDQPLLARLSHLAKQILTLSPRTREIVLDRLAYPNRPIRIVAERIGIKPATAHERLKAAREEWPALARAIPMKSWKWSRTEDSDATTEPKWITPSLFQGEEERCHH